MQVLPPKSVIASVSEQHLEARCNSGNWGVNMKMTDSDNGDACITELKGTTPLHAFGSFSCRAPCLLMITLKGTIHFYH